MCISNVTKIKNIQNIQVMANQNKTDIGLIGLAVMGENLALNMESKGWHVSVYNRTVPGVEEGVVERFLNGRAKGKNIEGFTDIKAFVDSIAIPRKIMMMVRAGSPVDELMDQLFPLLSPGDILIDGGNSNYEDTNRRVQLAESKGFLFVGSGVSGGEEGALNGASIMPGGSEKAWPEVKPILQSIAAKAPDGTPCCQWVGPAGSGHFVKMIHNGIEYGDMQLIAEAYWVMKKLLDLTNEEMADVFARWNEGKLRSYLIEITANILRHKDKSGGYLIDKILDAAGQKGTGKWSVINAMELGMPLGLIATAVFERSLSSQKDLRHLASKQFQCQHTQPIYNKAELVKNIFSALYASKLVSYAQGFAVLQRASDTFGWNLDLASIARMWRGGCIIRSVFLNDIAAAFEAKEKPKHLLLAPYFEEEIKGLLSGWKNLVAQAMREELPVPAFSSALNYFYSLVSADLPANLVQAQRDYFGAHTFERKDGLRGVFFHEKNAQSRALYSVGARFDRAGLRHLCLCRVLPRGGLADAQRGALRRRLCRTDGGRAADRRHLPRFVGQRGLRRVQRRLQLLHGRRQGEPRPQQAGCRREYARRGLARQGPLARLCALSGGRHRRHAQLAHRRGRLSQ